MDDFDALLADAFETSALQAFFLQYQNHPVKIYYLVEASVSHVETSRERFSV
jgi:hypothetical protein